MGKRSLEREEGGEGSSVAPSLIRLLRFEEVLQFGQPGRESMYVVGLCARRLIRGLVDFSEAAVDARNVGLERPHGGRGSQVGVVHGASDLGTSQHALQCTLGVALLLQLASAQLTELCIVVDVARRGRGRERRRGERHVSCHTGSSSDLRAGSTLLAWLGGLHAREGVRPHQA